MNKPHYVPLSEVDITGGFWAQRQKINREITVKSVYDRFAETGRFDAFKCDWHDGEPNRPHIFWDSDVAKWIEGAAYIIQKNPSPELEKIIDSVVDLIEKNQWEDGYFNICYTLFEPDDRFTARYNHELYCAGHLIEAAVAYSDATGKDKFLQLMCKYAALIEKAFVTEKWAEFDSPGHEEIELALIKLWRKTGEKRWLELSRHFVDVRGAEEDSYTQAHKPVREQEDAVGHAVRAVYLYCAMADLALETGDKELFAACKKLFSSIADKRMYITGGIGQTCVGEAFLGDYDLPNTSSYAETCASIGLALFARRMSLVEQDSRYADIAELALYNGALGGISLDGKSFFYDNANEIDLTGVNNPHDKRHNPFYPLTRRVEVFSCSCCPPNILRFIAELGGTAYSVDGNTVFCHQFFNSEMKHEGFELKLETSYPDSGEMRFTCGSDFVLAVRIPGWCGEYTVEKNARLIEPEIKTGYAYVPVEKGDTVTFFFDCEAKLVEANPLVRFNCGRVAVTKGPLVYCAEGVDNPLPLRDLRIDENAGFETVFDSELGVNALIADGFKRCKAEELYYNARNSLERTKIRLIPYFAYANRAESDMLIWLLAK